MKAKTIFWQALTPVHPGTGQDSSSVIDLPVAREAATRFPVIPASSLKGVLRDGRTDDFANKIYGSVDSAGELTLTDARVLLLPIRSYAGTFALITCPLVLERLKRDMQALGQSGILGQIPAVEPVGALVTSKTSLIHKDKQHSDKVTLEDLDLPAKAGADALAGTLSKMIFRVDEPYFLERFALVHDHVFAYFSEMGMEVIARVQLDGKEKTVNEGPWYEEAIPAETIFSCFAVGTNGFTELDRPYVQIGGQASVGRGLLRRLGGMHE